MTEKVLLKNAKTPDSHGIVAYEASGGYQALATVLRDYQPDELIELVKDSGLKGRGGAGFATGVKWSFVPKDPALKKYLCCNADEGEPGTFKDRAIMEKDPHQMIEGMILCAYAIGAETAYIYIRGEYTLSTKRLEAALKEAYDKGYLGQRILSSDVSLDIYVHRGAGAYICGEETALIESLEGRRGQPRLKPPFPAIEGLYASPTVVNNVETLANVPWIMANGAAAYRQMGSEASPGTRMFAISGHVVRPGVYEVEQGITTFRDLFYGEEYCQGIRDGHELKMFIPGGGSAPWFFAEHLDLPLEASEVGAAGSMLGSGAIIVMDETTDAVKACHRMVRFFARESCGKCSPCREGTSWEEKILARILNGHGRPSDIDLLLDVGDNISPGPYPVASHADEGLDAVPFPPRQTTICPLGPSSVAPITSTIRRFRHEFEARITRGDGIPVAAAVPAAEAGS